MNISSKLFAMLAQRLPAMYDVIPRGPIGLLPQARLSEVALNPQPLPPIALGAAVASEFVHTAWLADRFGLEQGLAFDELDDWCPTTVSKVKLPPWWGPSPEPEPRPEWFVDFHLGFVARLASVSDRFESTRLRETFDRAFERSMAAIESAQT
jgi:hypothetical protein